ncbi:MAG: sporulation transcription factor Spo0A [Clostridia bacterium]|nr:sporulation transcription factor Spo0A [Clostridia bacterium]
MIKVLLIEDNEDFANLIKATLQKEEDFLLIGHAKDGFDGAAKIEELKPDLVLLDVILPEYDGFRILECAKMGEEAPHIIICSVLSHENFIRRAFDIGASYYAVKPVNPKLLLQRMREVMRGEGFTYLDVREEERTEDKITSIFLQMGVPANILGYRYLREAVSRTVREPHLINKITKELYPLIAEANDTTPSKVERAIRHAIDVTWSRGRPQNVNEVFGVKVYSEKEKPTNGELIALLADKMLLERHKR